jgi:plastocyanin
MKFSVLILLLVSLVIFNCEHAVAAYVSQSDTVTVEVKGTDSDARFDPVVVKIKPGDVIQFLVREGLHTVTAYHPENRRPKRIPHSAQSFDSGLMEQGDQWFLTISKKGVYDYFCLPHEKLGHVGRIIAGSFDAPYDYPKAGIPSAVLQKLNTETEQFLNQ